MTAEQVHEADFEFLMKFLACRANELKGDGRWDKTKAAGLHELATLAVYCLRTRQEWHWRILLARWELTLKLAAELKGSTAP